MQGLGLQTSILRAEKGGEAFSRLQTGTLDRPRCGLLGPVLQHCGRHAQVSEAGGDDRVDHTVELSDGGTDGGCQVLMLGFSLWDQIEPRL